VIQLKRTSVFCGTDFEKHYIDVAFVESQLMATHAIAHGMTMPRSWPAPDGQNFFFFV